MNINNGIDKMLEESRSLERTLAMTLDGVRGPLPEGPTEAPTQPQNTMSKLEQLMYSLSRAQSLANELGNFFTDVNVIVGNASRMSHLDALNAKGHIGGFNR